jgi:hypothetical protein
MHQRIHVIEKWGNSSHIQSVVKKIKKINQKLKKIGQTINQAPTLNPKHDSI